MATVLSFKNITALIFNIVTLAMSKPKFRFRDVSNGLRKFRDFLLGRKYTLHGRFPPELAPRSIPPADIPRSMQPKYSEQYYFKRSAINSVKPPVVAPVGECPPLTKGEKKNISTCDTKSQHVRRYIRKIYVKYYSTIG